MTARICSLLLASTLLLAGGAPPPPAQRVTIPILEHPVVIGAVKTNAPYLTVVDVPVVGETDRIKIGEDWACQGVVRLRHPKDWPANRLEASIDTHALLGPDEIVIPIATNLGVINLRFFVAPDIFADMEANHVSVNPDRPTAPWRVSGRGNTQWVGAEIKPPVEGASLRIVSMGGSISGFVDLTTPWVAGKGCVEDSKIILYTKDGDTDSIVLQVEKRSENLLIGAAAPTVQRPAATVSNSK